MCQTKNSQPATENIPYHAISRRPLFYKGKSCKRTIDSRYRLSAVTLPAYTSSPPQIDRTRCLTRSISVFLFDACPFSSYLDVLVLHYAVSVNLHGLQFHSHFHPSVAFSLLNCQILHLINLLRHHCLVKDAVVALASVNPHHLCLRTPRRQNRCLVRTIGGRRK